MPGDQLNFLPHLSRAARGLLGWSVVFCARRAELSPSLLAAYEDTTGSLSDTEGHRLEAAFLAAGVRALPCARTGGGVRFFKPRTRFASAVLMSVPSDDPDQLGRLSARERAVSVDIMTRQIARSLDLNERISGAPGG